ncbi:MAG TPA: sigma-54-dependent Fis family transcriptional regulator [Nitrospirae bacterium]|nr:sigma-54-dependent Fis family transcriptional regulator [Nitrospirota bacterium]
MHLNHKNIVVAIVDEDTALLNLDREGFKENSIELFTFESLRELTSFLKSNIPDVIIIAIEKVEEQSIEIIKSYKSKKKEGLFYLLVSNDYDVVDIASEDIKNIVEDYLYKPINPIRLKAKIDLAIGKFHSQNRSLQIVDPIVRQSKPFFIFRSVAMQRALANLTEIALSDQTVLITGETGTGKEIVARAIHSLSRRNQGPFVPINCGAIPESLIEGELFGHEKGAFTGAIKTRKGKFENAHQGTLFLDEIGDMALHLQVRLLRVLEDKRVFRIGADEPIPVDVRVISATNTDLSKSVSKGIFREDLLYRLNVLRINLPPLRERREDIALLARHFFERTLFEMGRKAPYPEFSPETLYMLEKLPWKGNVRELRNVITRIATLFPTDAKKVFPFHVLQHLDETVVDNKNNFKQDILQESKYYLIPKDLPLSEVETIIINKTLERTGGNKSKAAKILGISLRTMRRKVNK